MTEHEMLKSICDDIWYKPSYEYWFWEYFEYDMWESLTIDLKLIIFTENFINLYQNYLFEKANYKYTRCNFALLLIENLDNPVEYLYNLI
jgi:hypothetical protein